MKPRHRRLKTDYPEHKCLMCSAIITTKTYCMTHLELVRSPLALSQPRGIHGTDVHSEVILKSGGYRHESINVMRGAR